MQKSSDQDSETWRDMIQNLPVAIVTALVLPLPFSACPGSGQSEPTLPTTADTTHSEGLFCTTMEHTGGQAPALPLPGPCSHQNDT